VTDVLIFALFFSAIACGWWLGRRSALSAAGQSPARLPGPYYRGLNYFLDGSTKVDIDSVITDLEDNSRALNQDTLETHLALAHVLRGRGEADRAIALHENLLARAGLTQTQRDLVCLELARDYIAAGLLDRAEELLRHLVAESEAQADVSRQHLVDIYRSEGEWRQAIEEARALLPTTFSLDSRSPNPQLSGQAMHIQLAHFYCELALQLVNANAHRDARKMLREARRADPHCARASLEIGRLEASLGNHRRAIKALAHVVEQHAEVLPEAIPVLRECYVALGEEQTLSAYLSRCLDTHPSTPLTIAVAEDIARERGSEAARDFLAQRLAQSPSLRGLLRFIRLQQENAGAQADGDGTLSMLSVLLGRLIEERPSYRCEHCGFAARQMLWFCPGCKYWGMFRSISRAEAE
jgi:lipopolysaccharide biosynthesis regulator YciM